MKTAKEVKEALDRVLNGDNTGVVSMLKDLPRSDREDMDYLGTIEYLDANEHFNNLVHGIREYLWRQAILEIERAMAN
jgi:hypothetical protein